jgi:hypothetical protein
MDEVYGLKGSIFKGSSSFLQKVMTHTKSDNYSFDSIALAIYKKSING